MNNDIEANIRAKELYLSLIGHHAVEKIQDVLKSKNMRLDKEKYYMSETSIKANLRSFASLRGGKNSEQVVIKDVIRSLLGKYEIR
jgi:hypothetical protein